MDLSPFLAQVANLAGQGVLHAVHFVLPEPVALPQLGRPVGAMKVKYRLPIRSDDMDVRGTMIVRIDPHSESIKAQNGWHFR